ncbi:uncharacterized protein LOC135388325 [Ornithodoros turicata]|uniref:uncharacterized protein LOC135388325 n=1 Tax=Ornithodoros turicata TaxID=34597 RepID=UPI003139C349
MAEGSPSKKRGRYVIAFCLVTGLALALVYGFLHRSSTKRAATVNLTALFAGNGTMGKQSLEKPGNSPTPNLDPNKLIPGGLAIARQQNGSRRIDMRLPELNNSGKPLSGDSRSRERATDINAEGPGYLICVVSSASTVMLQFPKQYCTHLVYSDVHFNPITHKIEPVNDATFMTFETMSVTAGLKLYVAIGGVTLQGLVGNETVLKTLVGHVVPWVTARFFHGIAFLGCSCASNELPRLRPVLEIIYNSVANSSKKSKMGLIVGMSLKDYGSPITSVAQRLSYITPFISILVLQTHYIPSSGDVCRTVLPSSLYPQTKAPGTLPIMTSLECMVRLYIDYKQLLHTCFSLSMSAFIFHNSSGPLSRCAAFSTENVMKVCDSDTWRSVRLNSTDILVEMRLRGSDLALHEGGGGLPVKISRALSKYPLACVAVFDVDQDDYEGVCGEPYASLASIRKSQLRWKPPNIEANASVVPLVTETLPPDSRARGSVRNQNCMPSGRESRVPLICILSDRTDVPRTVTKQFCTHIVLSIRGYGPEIRRIEIIHPEYLAGFIDSDAKLLLAIDESVLQSPNIRDIADYTAHQLKGRNMDGLAFLYVSRSSQQLIQLVKKLQVLHSVYEANSLCLMLGAELSDYIQPPEDISFALGTVAQFVDILVVQTHYSENMGLCQAVPVSNFEQPGWSCVPRVAIETALNWMRLANITSTLPISCFSVDMRVLRYTMQDALALERDCYTEDSVDFGKACMDEGWASAYDSSTMTMVGTKGHSLQSFESPQTLLKKISAARKIFPDACVAVFNYDYEDWQGVCRSDSYARMEAIRIGLDNLATEDNTTGAGAEDLFPTAEPLFPIKYAANPTAASSPEPPLTSDGRPLICVLSDGEYVENQIPRKYCTHLVHLGASFNFSTSSLIVPDSIWKYALLRPNMRHYLGFNSIVSAYFTYTGPGTGEGFATVTALTLRSRQFNGIAIINVNKTSRSSSRLIPILKAIKKVYAGSLDVIVGLEITDLSVPPKTLATRMSDITRYADVVILQTHYRGPAGYCQVAFPSIYNPDSRSPTAPLVAALEWARTLSGNQHTCVSFSMAVQEFYGSEKLCIGLRFLLYESLCPAENYVEETNSSGSFCNLRHREGVWQTFETPELISVKVSMALQRYSLACIALYNVDYEDYRHACPQRGDKFARLAAVDAAYKAPHGALNQPKKTSEEAEENHRLILDPEASRLPEEEKFREAPLINATGDRPFLCFLSIAWRDTHSVPKHYCTHIIFEIPHDSQDLLDVQVLIDEVREQSKPGRKYLLGVRFIPRDNATRYMEDLAQLTKDLDMDGVAVIDLRMFSISVGTIVDSIKTLRESLHNRTVVIGIDVADFSRKPTVIAGNLKPLLQFTDVLIFQTHFRQLWKFCRTSHVSVFKDTENTCLQSVPMTTALKWMKKLNSNVKLCMSFNMAALKFDFTGNPVPGALCSKVTETAQICETGFTKEDSSDKSLTVFRYKRGRWVSLESEELIKKKVTTILSTYTKACFAAFNADYDLNTEACSKRKENFARLKQIGRTARYPRDVGQARRTTGKPTTEHTESFVPLEQKNVSGTLVCLLQSIQVELLPGQLCDIAVFTGIKYNGANASLEAQSESAFNTFKSLQSHKVRLAVALKTDDVPFEWSLHPKDVTRFASSVTAWLHENALHGIVLLVSRAAGEDDPHISFVEALVRKFRRFTSNRNMDLIVALPAVKRVVGYPESLFRNSDMIIFMTHQPEHEKTCRVHNPSTMSSMRNDFTYLDTTVSLMMTVQNKVKASPKVCVSVNLAVLSFVTSDGKPELGVPCKKQALHNYAETCSTDIGGEHCDHPSLSCSARNASHFVTFEDEESVQLKVHYLKKLFPNVCVAAFNVDMEDSSGNCIMRRPFSRLLAIQQAFNLPSLLEGRADLNWKASAGNGTSRSGKSGNPASDKSPRRSLPSEGRMVCVFSQNAYYLRRFPVELCTHLVYSHVEYASENSSILPFHGSAFQAFLSVNHRNRTKRLVTLDTSQFPLLNDDFLDKVTTTVAKWLSGKKLNGVALITPRWSDAHRMLRVLKFLRSYFDKYALGRLQTVVGLPLIKDSIILKEIAEQTNILIIMAHHEEGPYCGSPLPVLNTFNELLMMRISRFIAQLDEKKLPTHVCPSLSFAVLQTSSKVLSKNRCYNGTFVTYEKACPSQEYPTMISEGTLDAYRETEDTLQNFETEETIIARMSTAKRFWPLNCAAIFHVDYEDFDEDCHAMQPYSRVKMMSHLVGVSHENKENKKPSQELPNQPLNTTRIRTLVCMVPQDMPDMNTFPVEACDYLVYTGEIPNGRDRQGAALASFTSFLEYRGRPGLSLAVGFNFSSLVRASSDRSSPLYTELKGMGVWLTSMRLNGLALMVTDEGSVSVESVLFTTSMIRRGFKPSHRLTLMLVIHPPEDSLKALLLSKDIDMVILMAYSTGTKDLCKTVYPSSVQDTVASRLDKAKAILLSILEQPSDVQACFAINFGVLNVGTRCSQAHWKNYNEVCHATGVQKVDNSLAFQNRNGSVWIFENEDTISYKVIPIVARYPEACVAGFNLHYEDHEGSCDSKGTSYPRLRALRSAVDVQVSPNEEGKPPADLSASHPRRRRVKDGSAVCVFSYNAVAIQLPPVGTCDYLVFESVTVDLAKASISVRVPKALFDSFYKLRSRKDLKLIVGATSQSLPGEFCMSSRRFRRLASSIIEWVQTRKLHGIAGFLKTLHRTRKIHGILRALNDVPTKRHYQPLLVLGMPVTFPADLILKYASLVNLLVLYTHHYANPEPCRIAHPANFYENPASKSSMEEIGNIIQQVSKRTDTTICASFTMAVFKFELHNSDSFSYGDDCSSVEWSSYSEICRAKKDHEDPRAVLPHFRNDSTLFTYEDSASVEKRTKHFLKIHSSGCVAVFDLDKENAVESCAEPFSRVRKIRSLLKPTAKTIAIPVQPTKPVEQQPQRNTLVCAGLTKLTPYVVSMCDYIIVCPITYDVSKAIVYQPKGVNWVDVAKHSGKSRMTAMVDEKSFKKLVLETHLKTFASKVTSWVRRKGLCGLAVMHTVHSTAESIISHLRAESSSTKAPLKLIALLPPAKEPEEVASIARSVDILVFLTHRLKATGKCKVVLPSAFQNGSAYHEIGTVAELGEEVYLQSLQKTEVCFSTSMAVIKVHLQPQNTKIQDACVNETWVNYAQTCPTVSVGTHQRDLALQANIFFNKSYMMTFEDEHTVAWKVRRYLDVFPQGCVASFALDLEDASGNCTARNRYSRLWAVRSALDTYGVQKVKEAPLRHEPVPVLCALSSNATVLKFPEGRVCDYIVTLEVTYSAEKNVIRPITDDALGRHMKCDVSIFTKRLLLLNPLSLDALRDEDDDKILSFVASVVQFAKQVSADGLLLISIETLDQKLDEITKTIWQGFANANPHPRDDMGGLTLAVGAAIDTSETDLALVESMATHSDILVYIPQPQSAGEVCSSGNSSKICDLSPFSSSLKRIRDNPSAKARICPSASMAVRGYSHRNGEECSVARSHNYSEVCNLSSNLNILRNKTYIQTWEESEDVIEKVKAMYVAYKATCVAVFDVDYDDAAGTCYNMSTPFLRVLEVSNAMRALSAHGATPPRNVSTTTTSDSTESTTYSEPQSGSFKTAFNVTASSDKAVTKKTPLYPVNGTATTGALNPVEVSQDGSTSTYMESSSQSTPPSQGEPEGKVETSRKTVTAGEEAGAGSVTEAGVGRMGAANYTYSEATVVTASMESTTRKHVTKPRGTKPRGAVTTKTKTRRPTEKKLPLPHPKRKHKTYRKRNYATTSTPRITTPRTVPGRSTSRDATSIIVEHRTESSSVAATTEEKIPTSSASREATDGSILDTVPLRHTGKRLLDSTRTTFTAESLSTQRTVPVTDHSVTEQTTVPAADITGTHSEALSTHEPARRDAERTLLCVFSTQQRTRPEFPARLCTHLVYMEIEYEINEDKIHPSDDTEFRTFVEIASSTQVYSIVGWVARTLFDHPSRVMVQFLETLKKWLTYAYLDGVALFLPTREHIVNLAVLTSMFRKETPAQGHILVIGVPPSKRDQSTIRHLARDSDILILLFHRMTPEEHCRIHTPSPTKTTDYSFLREVAEFSERERNTCFSVSLFVSNFSLLPKRISVGDVCVEEDWVNYAATCGKEVYLSDSAAFAVAEDRKHMLVFENEETLTTQVNTFLAELPYGCVAVFDVNFEDELGQCSDKHKHSRLSVLSRLVTGWSDQETTQETATHTAKKTAPTQDTSTVSYPAEKVPKKKVFTPDMRPLVCVFSGRRTLGHSFPSDLCTFLVYTGITYNFKDAVIYVTNGLQAFLTLAATTTAIPIAVLDHTPVVGESKTGSHHQMATFLSTLVSWLSQHAMHGVALFSAGDDMKAFADALAILVQHFNNQQTPRPLAIVGAPFSARKYDHLESLICNSDVFVFLAHRRKPRDPCAVPQQSSFALTSEDIMFANEMQSSQSVKAPICVSVNLAVQSYTLLSNATGTPFGSVCVEERWKSYSTVCNDHLQTEYINDTAYQTNGSHLWIFEDDTSLNNKVDPFVRQVQKGCVAAVAIEYEENDGNCSTKPAYPRLSALADLLSRPIASINVVTTAPQNGSSSPRKNTGVQRKAKYAATLGSRSLVCVISKLPANGRYPGELCSHIVFMSIDYDLERHTVRRTQELEAFLEMAKNNETNYLVALSHVLLKSIEDEEYYKDDFLRSVTTWLSNQSLDGIALFGRGSDDPERFAETVAHIWGHFKSLAPETTLLVGVDYAQYVQKHMPVLERLGRSADILIFTFHQLLPPTHCKVTYPASDVYNSNVFSFLRSVANHTCTCLSFNLAVNSFKVATTAAGLGDSCTQQSQIPFSETCDAELNATQDKHRGVYWQNSTTVRTYEDDYSIAVKMEEYSRLHPTGCAAAFGTEYEDFDGSCTKRRKYSRLKTISNALHEQPGALICVFSTNARGVPSTFPSRLCTYIVYSYISFNTDEQRIVPSNGASFDSFLKVKKYNTMPLAAICPVALSNLIASSEALSRFVTAVLDWLVIYSVRGLVIVPAASTHTAQAVGVISEISKTLRQVRDMVLQVVVGVPAPWTDVDAVKRIAEYADLILYVTHSLKPHGSCTLEPSSPGWDIIAFKLNMKSLEQTKMPTICLTLNFAVIHYEMKSTTPNYGDPCLSESWESYSQMCNKTATQKPGWTRVYECERSTKEKTSAFLESYPKGCVAAFAVDMEDENECLSRPAYPRLQIISSLLGQSIERDNVSHNASTTAPRVEVEGRKYMKGTARRKSTGPLVCIFSPSAPMPVTFPNELCAFVVYTYATYDIQRGVINAFLEERLEKFIKLVDKRKRTALVGLSPTELNAVDAADSKAIDSFTRSVNGWLQNNHLGGVAMFSTALTDIVNFVRVVEHLWKHFHQPLELPKHVIVGIQGAVSRTEEAERIARASDVLIILTLPLVASASCRILPPSPPNIISDLLHQKNALNGTSHLISACLSINLAVLTFEIKDGQYSFGESCGTETWANFAQTCPKNNVRSDIDEGVVTAVRKNDTFIQTFENDRTIGIKFKRFLNDHPKGCAAVFNVDYEDWNGSCESRSPYSRLHAISRLLSSGSEQSSTPNEHTPPGTTAASDAATTSAKRTEETSTTAENTEGRPNVTAKPTRRWHRRHTVLTEQATWRTYVKRTTTQQPRKSTLVCVLSSAAPIPPPFPEDVCQYVVYAYINYYAEDNIVEASHVENFEHFLKSLRETRATPIGAIAPITLNALEVQDQERMDEFLSAVTAYVNEKSLGGIAAFPPRSLPPSDLADLVDVMWYSLHATPGHQKRLLVGIREPLRDIAIMKRLTLTSDLVIVITHPLVPAGDCRIAPPNSGNYEELFKDMKHRYTDIHPDAEVCFAINFAVRTFLLDDPKGSFGSTCLSESWESFVETCPAKYTIRTEVDRTSNIAFRRNGTVFQAFETKHTLSKKLKSFPKLHPHGCLAAFYVNFEDYKGECRSRTSYSRLEVVSSALSRNPDMLRNATGTTASSATTISVPGTPVSHPSTLADASSTQTQADKGHSPGYLICVLSSVNQLPSRIPPAVCHYLVYSFVAYIAEEDSVTPNDEERFQKFQQLAEHVRATPVAAVEPDMLDSFLDRTDANQTVFLEDCAYTVIRWVNRKSLGGLGLFTTRNTIVERFGDLVNKMWMRIHSKEAKKTPKLLVGVHTYQLDARTAEGFSKSSDMFIFLSVSITLPSSCKIRAPTSPNIINDSLNLNPQKSTQLNNVCISINLAVHVYQNTLSITRLGDNCTRENLEGYGKVCPMARSEVQYDSQSMTNFLHDGNRLLTFEDELTIASKMTAFQEIYPSGCAAAFDIDFEDVEGTCRNRESFSRLKALARVVSMEGQGPSTTTIQTTRLTASTAVDIPKERGTKRTDNVEKARKRLLICVLSTVADLPTELPSDMCDYLVYSYITYSFSKRTVQPNDEARFAKFEGLAKKSGATTVGCVVPSFWSRFSRKGPKAVNDFVTGITLWAERRSVDGIAALSTPSTDMIRFVRVVQELWESLHSLPSGIKLIVGFHPSTGSSLQKLVTTSDITILMTHRLSLTDPCEVTHPSTTLMTTDSYRVILNHTSKTTGLNRVCMDINLAVMRFQQNSTRVTFGDRCLKESWENYAETCPNTTKMSSEEDSVSAYQTGMGVLQSYETENSVAVKELTFSEVFPKGCVAAFNVDFEDFNGKCLAREQYSRLRTIAVSLLSGA